MKGAKARELVPILALLAQPRTVHIRARGLVSDFLSSTNHPASTIVTAAPATSSSPCKSFNKSFMFTSSMSQVARSAQ